MGKGNRNRNMTETKKQTGKPRSTGIWLKIGAWSLAALFLVILVFGVAHTSGFLQKSMTAVTVGDSKMSALDFNIFYNDTLNSFLNEYGSTLQMYGYDLSAGFESQTALFGDGEQTWRDYFREEAVATASNTLVLYNEAIAAGHVMDSYYSKLYDESVASISDTASYYGMTPNAFLSSAYSYGNGTKLADVERVLNMKMLALSFAQSIYDSYEYSDADIEAEYQNNKDTYDVVDYYSYKFPYTVYTFTAPEEGEEVPEGQPQSADEATQMTEESMAAAKAQADEFFARLSAGEEFDSVAGDYYFLEEATHEHGEGEEHEPFATALTTHTTLTDGTTLTAWLIDTDRAKADRTVLDVSGAYNVVEFVERYRNEVPTATVRHVLKSYETAASDASDEQKAIVDANNGTIFTSAQALYTEWMLGGALEQDFIELAKEHSEDGNAEDGGIYEHFPQGAMVESFDEWCFDPERKYGDSGMVVTEYGAHIMFFVSFDKPNYYYTIESKLKTAAYEAHVDRLTNKYKIGSSAFAMAFLF